MFLSLSPFITKSTKSDIVGLDFFYSKTKEDNNNNNHTRLLEVFVHDLCSAYKKIKCPLTCLGVSENDQKYDTNNSVVCHVAL